MDETKIYLHHWLLPLNGLQGGTPYAGRPGGIIPEFVVIYQPQQPQQRYIAILAFSLCFESFNHRWEGNHGGGKDIVLHFLNTEVNCPRTEAFMGLENWDPFFGEDYTRC